MTRAEQLARAVLDGSATDEDVKELARLVPQNEDQRYVNSMRHELDLKRAASAHDQLALKSARDRLLLLKDAARAVYALSDVGRGNHGDCECRDCRAERRLGRVLDDLDDGGSCNG